MELVRLILLFVHILGFAALLGGLLAQAGSSEKLVNAPMRDGAGTAFLAGLGLVGVLEASDQSVDHVTIGVKLSVGLLVLTVANIAIAVFWAPVHR